MLKMRRVWRRTSSSQADPSPWRHCWTSWASCSNVSRASKPTTVQGVSASRLLSQKTAGSPSRPANYGTKTAEKMFPFKPGQAFNRHCGHLTGGDRGETSESRRVGHRNLGTCAAPAALLVPERSASSRLRQQAVKLALDRLATP